MGQTYPETSEVDEIGGFSAGSLGVVVLLTAVPVLLAVSLGMAQGSAPTTGAGINPPGIVTARGDGPPEQPSEAPAILQQAKLILEEIKAVAVPPERPSEAPAVLRQAKRILEEIKAVAVPPERPSEAPVVLRQAKRIIEEIKAVAVPPERPSVSPTVLQQTKPTPEKIEALAVPLDAEEYAAIDAAATLAVDLLTPRGSEPTYNASETLEITVDVSENAYVYCYYQNGAGTIARVFPNRFQPDAFVEVGRPLTIPGRDAPFQIVFDLPGVVEIVSCIAADRDMGQIAMLAPDFMPMQIKSLQQIATVFTDNARAQVSQANMRIQIN